MSDRTIPYIKASGCGNVFILIEADQPDPDRRREISVRACKELGADGVEWIQKSDGPAADVDAVLINADGSEAGISGNGTRCVAARWAAMHGGEMVRVRTGAGVKECTLIARNGDDFEFEMDLGAPGVEGEVSLQLASGAIKGTKLSMGNPQFVVFVDDFRFPWRERGAEIQAHKIFTQGTNVDFVRVISSHEIEARFFERGVGETQSSGTGSCASAVAAITAGRATSPVKVNAAGGAQTVLWNGGVLLRGPARLESEGVLRF